LGCCAARAFGEWRGRLSKTAGVREDLKVGDETLSQLPAQMALPDERNPRFLNEGRRIASAEFSARLFD